VYRAAACDRRYRFADDVCEFGGGLDGADEPCGCYPFGDAARESFTPESVDDIGERALFPRIHHGACRDGSVAEAHVQGLVDEERHPLPGELETAPAEVEEYLCWRYAALAQALCHGAEIAPYQHDARRDIRERIFCPGYGRIVYVETDERAVRTESVGEGACMAGTTECRIHDGVVGCDIECFQAFL
jgi:hypothetical protein